MEQHLFATLTGTLVILLGIIGYFCRKLIEKQDAIVKRIDELHTSFAVFKEMTSKDIDLLKAESDRTRLNLHEIRNKITPIVTKLEWEIHKNKK